MNNLDLILCDFLHDKKDSLLDYVGPGKYFEVEISVMLNDRSPLDDMNGEPPQFVSHYAITYSNNARPEYYVGGGVSFHDGTPRLTATLKTTIDQGMLASCCLVAKTTPCNIPYTVLEYRINYMVS